MNLDDWSVTITGEVVRVDRENIDKSGQNPRYIYTFVVKPSALDGMPHGATLGDEVSIRTRDQDLEKLAATAPAAGAQVVMTARASGARPRLLQLTALGTAE